MSDVVIRPAREAELDDPARREEVRKQLQVILRDPEAALFVAEGDGALVGLAEVYLRRDEPHPLAVSHTYGYLQSLVVTAGQRGRGLGTQLVAAAETWVRVRGATQLRLEAWEFAAGPLLFYEALGYRTAKRTLVKPLG